MDEVTALTGSQVFGPVWDIPGSFGTVGDEGRLSLLGIEHRGAPEG